MPDATGTGQCDLSPGIWDDHKKHTDLETAKRWFDFLENHTDFDQLILETSNGKDYWIHVSCRKNRKKNRHQVIHYLKK